jgi:pyruvate-formate lyase-activating enzyme
MISKSLKKVVDEPLKEKLRYLINSSCTFFITILMVLYEDEQELKRIYKLSNESLESIIKIRKELLQNNEK